MDLRAWILDDHAGLADRFERAVAANVPVERWTERVGGRGSSIAWLVLHTTLHEDLAITTAVRAQAPRWQERRDELGLADFPPHAGLGETEQPAVTAALDVESVRAYAADVHDDVQGWMATVDLDSLGELPPAGARIDALAGVTAEAVPWLHAMWDARPAAWFVRWEAIGHRQGHLGEMIAVRGHLGLSPF